MPLFSVVIPLYNKADTIERTLRSVAGQVSRDFEVVVVDDGSKDDGAAIVERFEGLPSLRVIRQTNAGVSAARNKGVAESRGKFMAFLDADDEWMPMFLKEMADVLAAHPEARILGSGYERVANGRLYRCRPRRKLFVCNLFKVWPYFQPMNSSSIVIEKRAFEEVGGYREDLRFWEDGELWFRLAARNKFYIVRKPLSRYNDDAQNAATNARSRIKKTAPHMELLGQWIRKGRATPEMKGCLCNTRRMIVARLTTDPLFWIYKRIRFYLWFSRSRGAFDA